MLQRHSRAIRKVVEDDHFLGREQVSEAEAAPESALALQDFRAVDPSDDSATEKCSPQVPKQRRPVTEFDRESHQGPAAAQEIPNDQLGVESPERRQRARVQQAHPAEQQPLQPEEFHSSAEGVTVELQEGPKGLCSKSIGAERDANDGID